MVYGDLVHLESKTYIYNYDFLDFAQIIREVIPETVGQYIGLPDSKSKDVYDGDRIYAPSFTPSYMEIRFIEGGYCAWWEDCGDYTLDIKHFYPSIGCQFEVIGTIHDKDGEE